jgi:hypothetical protein
LPIKYQDDINLSIDINAFIVLRGFLKNITSNCSDLLIVPKMKITSPNVNSDAYINLKQIKKV